MPNVSLELWAWNVPISPRVLLSGVLVLSCSKFSQKIASKLPVQISHPWDSIFGLLPKVPKAIVEIVLLKMERPVSETLEKFDIWRLQELVDSRVMQIQFSPSFHNNV